MARIAFSNFESPGSKSTRPSFAEASVLVRNPIVSALLWASKSDRQLISICSNWGIATQIALGFFVFFTAALALGGAYYTLSTVRASGLWPLWIALGWSCFVFMMDREIVGGLDKASALLRPFLALLLGTIVAIPIELFVFEARVDQELQRTYLRDNAAQLQNLRDADAGLESRRAELQANIASLRKQEAQWGVVMDEELAGREVVGRTGMRGAGPVFQNAGHQQDAVRQRIQEAQRELAKFEEALPAARQRFESEYQREQIDKVTDFVTRYEAMDRVVHSSNALYRLSWVVTLTLILIEMTPALVKLVTPHHDYHHLVRADIRERIARIDELSDRNYRLAMENPDVPELSVAEKLAIVNYSPIRTESVLGGRRWR